MKESIMSVMSVILEFYSISSRIKPTNFSQFR